MSNENDYIANSRPDGKAVEGSFQKPGPTRPDYYINPSYYGGGFAGSDNDDENGLSVMKWIQVLLRRRKTILLLMIVGGLCGALYLTQAVSIYRAEAQFEMSVRRPKIIQNNAIFEDQSGDLNSVINTRFAKFRSPAMEQLAAESYREKYPDTGKSDDYLAFLVRSAVNWQKDRNANIVRVSMESSDNEFAARLVNILSECAGTLMVMENQQLSDAAVKWLADQAEEQRIALEKVEGELSTLRQAVQLDALSQERAAQGEALKVLIQEKTAIESRLREREMVADYVKAVNVTKMEFSTLPLNLLNEFSLQGLLAQWRDAEDNLIELDRRYSDIHPAYKAAVVEEQRTSRRLKNAIVSASSDIENEVKLLNAQLLNLNERVGVLRQKAAELELKVTSGEQKLQRLQRKHEAAETAYQAVLKRMEEARMSADETTAFTKVIREASVPTKAIYPKTFNVIAIALVFGLIAGVGVALLMELWADEVSSVGELKGFGLKILGTIPSQKSKNSRDELASIGIKDKFSHVFEVFAGINGIITSPKYKDRTKVLLLSSVMPGEGKTVSACNLAISSALNGSKTLLIDGDLRRPRLAQIFGVDKTHPSLLEWLAQESGGSIEDWLSDSTDPALLEWLASEQNELDFDDLVWGGVHKNLDVMISKPLKNVNPAELLGRGRLEELIAWARTEYDSIIIDTPPFGFVGDTQMFANFADSVIIVSRLGLTRKRALRFTVERLVELDTHVLGCIANDVPHSLAGKFRGGSGKYVYGEGIL